MRISKENSIWVGFRELRHFVSPKQAIYAGNEKHFQSVVMEISIVLLIS